MTTPTKTKSREVRHNYPDHDWEEFGTALRDVRTSRDITQAELATAIGFRSHCSISQIESGIKPMTNGKLNKAAKFLGVLPTEIRPENLGPTIRTARP